MEWVCAKGDEVMGRVNKSIKWMMVGCLRSLRKEIDGEHKWNVVDN